MTRGAGSHLVVGDESAREITGVAIGKFLTNEKRNFVVLKVRASSIKIKMYWKTTHRANANSIT